MPTFDLGLVKGPKGDTGQRGEKGIQGPRGYPAMVNGISPDDSGNITLTAGNVGAYSKSESDTLLQNKATAGYGFGDPLQTLEATSDETYEAFCSRVDAVLATMPDNTCKLITYNPPNIRGAYNTPAVLFKLTDGVACVRHVGSFYGSYNNIRDFYTISAYKSDGVWSSLEWTNPPMLLGVEYRTTERFNGYPVYKRAVNIGDITGDGKSTFASNGATTVLSGELLYNGYLPFNFIHERNLSSSWTRYANVVIAGSTIEVDYYIGSSFGTSKNTVIILRYLKD